MSDFAESAIRVRVFSIATQSPESGAAELNAFLAAHRVVHLERQFVADGANSFWSICVTYVPNNGTAPAGKSEKIDYRETLPEAEFAIYAKLRALRKTIAEKDGVPAYALFTNEQMAEMVRQKATSLESLRRIKGIGAARVEKYGAAFLEVLKGPAETPSANLFGDKR